VKDEDDKEEKIPKKAGRKPTKEKREEIANVRKLLGTQTTIERSLGTRTRTIKNRGITTSSHGRGLKSMGK
jgi:hypothetical protein